MVRYNVPISKRGSYQQGLTWQKFDHPEICPSDIEELKGTTGHWTKANLLLSLSHYLT